MSKSDYWDLTNRPHTKLKLEIYKKYLDSWCVIFENQSWYQEVFIVDCFAGKGLYKDGNNFIDGSPLITLKAAKKFQEHFLAKTKKNKASFKIKCIFIEQDDSYCKNLNTLLAPYSKDVDFEIISKDFNNIIGDVIKKTGNKPALIFIDPFGIKGVKKESILSIVNKQGAKDILFNYINEGVVRVGGLAKKCAQKKIEDVTVKELKTIEHLKSFIGEDFLKFIDSNDKEILKYYVENILKSNNSNVNQKNKLEVIAFNMPYPHKSDTIYYLLFASRNANAIKIVRHVYAKSKEKDFDGQKSLFDAKIQSKMHNDFKV